MITLTHLYDTYSDAQSAVRELTARNVPMADISIVANNVDGIIDRDRDGTDDRAEGAATGATVGAALGGAAGLLAGLGMMAIPGIGPVVAAGWLASTAVGAAAAGTVGGVIGALTQAGVKADDAEVYAEGIRRGGALVSVRVPETRSAEMDEVLSRHAVDQTSRAAQYRAEGWNRFDPALPPMTPDRIREVRSWYGRDA